MVCQNVESNENSSSEIEEVPVGRRSMKMPNMLVINNISNSCAYHTPPCPLYLRGGSAKNVEL